ncbi:MAG: hypothetical protein R2762_10960 [Bryobacteraceae bacterium]
MTTLAVWTGTLILFLPAQHGYYVSADSRHDGGPAAEADEAKKIFLCGPHAVCAISGALRMTVTRPSGDAATFDLSAALDRAARAATIDVRANVIAAAIYAELRTFWVQHLAMPVAARLSERTLAPSVSTILFAHRDPDTGKVELAQIQFPFVETQVAGGAWTHELRPPVIRPADAARPLAQGKTECMMIRADEPPAVETRAQTLATVKALYARTQTDDYCKSIIGGPIHVAVLDEEGARWLEP